MVDIAVIQAQQPKPENELIHQAAQIIGFGNMLARLAVKQVWEAGFYLIHAKKQLKHGEWIPALQREGIPERQAQRAMQLCRYVEYDKLSDFSSVNAAETCMKEDKKGFHHGNTGYREWFTPEFVIELARETTGGFTLDPASCEAANETVRADRFFTEQENGLLQDWSGHRVWLNPPYDKDCREFSLKFTHSDIESGCCLVNALVASAEYGQELLANADAVCFLAGRLRFRGPKSKNSPSQQNSMVVYRGKEPEKFAEVFGRAGKVLKLFEPDTKAPLLEAPAPLLKLANG